MAYTFALYFNRFLTQDERSVELFLSVYDEIILSTSLLSQDTVDAVRLAQDSLSVLSGSNVPNFETYGEGFSFLTQAGFIPQRIPAGNVLVRLQGIEENNPTYYDVTQDLYFREGSTFPWVSGSFQYDVPTLSLSFVLSFGLLLTYTFGFEEYPSIIPPEISEDYFDEYVNRSAIAWRIPRVWGNEWRTIFERRQVLQGGYYHIIGTGVNTSYLWAYPPASEDWDMRRLNSSEELIWNQNIYSFNIEDSTDDYPIGFSFMPEPNAANTRRVIGSGFEMYDQILIRTSAMPSVFYPKNLTQQPESTRRGGRNPLDPLTKFIPIETSPTGGVPVYFGTTTENRNPFTDGEKVLIVAENIGLCGRG